MINKIYILESIPANEKQTGEELYNDTIYRYNLLYNSEIENWFLKINSKNEIISKLNYISETTKSADEIILHIEAHGNKLEMELSNGERISWSELTKYLISINEKCNNKLHLNLATCFSMHVGMAIDLKKTAPYKSFLAVLEKISPHDILNDNTLLYDEIIKTKEMYKAFVNFEKKKPNTKFRIKDVETVIDFHVIPHLTTFLKSGSFDMVKSFFENYLNISIDLVNLQNSENPIEYILTLFKNRFLYNSKTSP